MQVSEGFLCAAIILEARARRGKFTKYKTAKKSSAEREKLRGEYLDMAGTHKNWRSGAEKFEKPPQQ